MNRKFIIVVVTVASIALTVGVVQAAGTHNVTSQFGPDGDIFQVNGTMKMSSVMIGEQGVGGVTYFNGSIVNSTTESGADNPVTFGDNMRVDGRMWRGAIAGPGDSQPFIINDDMEVLGTLTVAGLEGIDIVSSDNITDATIATADLADDAVTSAKIADGTVATDDLASGSVTSAKITDTTIATADLADDAVTPAKINGIGGANLPLAYGWCNDDGTTRGGTSNVSCSWNAGQYEITIAGVDYDYREKIAVVNAVQSGYIPAVSSVGGDFVVDFTTYAGVANQQADFNFIIYDM